MPGAGERFDIVVIGVQADEQAPDDLAADLSSLTGLPPHKVSLALRGGELIVHRSLSEEEAHRAASTLRRRGAEIEIRSTAASEQRAAGFVGEIPDVDAVLDDFGLRLPDGGAPIAPPPEFGGAAAVRSIDIGARPTSAPGLLDPSRPQGRPPPDLTSERPFAPAFAKAAGRARPTPHEGAPVQRPRNGAPRKKKPREPYVGTPRRSRPSETREASGQIADAQALADSLEAAAASAEAIEVVTLDGQSSESVEVKLVEPEAPGPEAGVKPEASSRSTMPHDERLALDLRGAAADTSTSGQLASASVRATSQPASRTGSFAGAARPAHPPTPMPVALQPVGKPLFSRDRWANSLFGVAVGLGLGMVIAFAAVRVWHRGDVIALEEELAASYAKPIEVRSGDVRAPDEIERDLDAKYGDSRIFFLLAMLLSGVPAGLGLGRVRL